MKHIKQLAALLLVALLIFGSVVAVSANTTVTINGFSFYTNDEGEAVIVGYDDNSSNMEIPYSLLNAKVTEIADNAFWADNIIKNISFEKATELRRIGSNAFYSCTALESLTLPYLDELGFGAFRGCTSLKNLTVNAGLKTVAAQAFDSCESLTSVTFENGVESIGEYAFKDCNSLKSVSIPYSVTDIGDCAFGYYFDNDKNTYVKVENFKIYGYNNTKAETYSKDNGFEFVSLGDIPDLSSKTDISQWNVSGIKNKTYTGKAIKQDNIIVSKEGKYADFDVDYKNNLNVGTATVIITGKGDYEGSITKTFKITKAGNPITVKITAKAVKLAAVKKKAQTVKGAITVKKAQGKVSYKLISVPKALKKLVKINSKSVITIKKWAKAKKGTYKLKVNITAAGNKNYNSKSLKKTVTIKVK